MQFLVGAVILPKLSQGLRKQLENIRELQAKDKRFGPLIEDVKKGTQIDRFRLIYGILIKKDHVNINNLILCVPEELAKPFVKDFHEQLGHYGIDKTLWALKRVLKASDP